MTAVRGIAAVRMAGRSDGRVVANLREMAHRLVQSDERAEVLRSTSEHMHDRLQRYRRAMVEMAVEVHAGHEAVPTGATWRECQAPACKRTRRRMLENEGIDAATVAELGGGE